MTEFVSSILGSLAEKLGSSAVEEIQLVWGVKHDRERLKSKLEMIQKVLADAEHKQTKEAAVRLWLSKLKDFCYDVEDVLDEFEARALWRRARSTEHLTLKRKVRYLSSWPSNFIFQFKMAHKMKELRTRLDEINEEKAKFNLSSDAQDKTIVPLRETHSFVTPLNVIGRKKEKERIIELLIRSGDAGAGMMAIVPIIGMGGAGKTTLAKFVYNDDKVNEHFKDNKIWLSMPVEFELKKIIGNILESLDQKEKYDSLEMLQKRLRSTIANKRYLFVMDDVWQVSKEDWEKPRDLLGGVSEGSKVIVTSRNESIASIMGTVLPLKLAELSQEYSLTLFVKYAFNPGQEKNHPDLMEIGKEIVSKCGGNPMAVKTLGSLLYSKNNRSDWEYVRDSEMWELQTNILPSLRISYDLMPSSLKRCFAYCSIFPKNHEFGRFELIQLWISSRFIQSSGNSQEPEEIGRRYLEELRSRSFFDVVLDAYMFQVFRMHDLIYELAISVGQPESSNMKVWTQDISPMTRHISFPNPSGVPKDELSRCLSKLSHVRTIICEGLGSSDSEEFFMETCISRFKHLRVLWLNGSSFDLLPSSIGGLKHLRFLSLNDNRDIKKLPKSVCELHNLQYLGLGKCEELEELPANIKNMFSLRVLIITTKQQRFPERGIGCLTSLRWLFIAKCENLEALFNDIQSLTSLRKLVIGWCPKCASLPQGIKNLKALEDLMIGGCQSLKLPGGESNEPGSMSRLQSFIFGELPEIVSLPGWLEGSASTLQTIKIKDCPKLSVLPEWLRNCSSLRKLEIEDCPELSSLPDGFRRIPTLTELRISGCGELSSRGEEEEDD
ncbi:putative disease resistance protein RGA3 [Syzygium oleosum]|uniref:putative disease resistance protein RGA3 n=1 Tax=Syzygium oleosum TaxID=219896 RepID=UPI0011D1F219|nr:putative disease resistance protein RGA3 [Syzygium oleosum]